MSCFVYKQKNGKFCRWSFMLDSFTNLNLTLEDLEKLANEGHILKDYIREYNLDKDYNFNNFLLLDYSTLNDTLDEYVEDLSKTGLNQGELNEIRRKIEENINELQECEDYKKEDDF